MCRPSTAVGLLILSHYLTSWCNCPRAFFSQDTFNCLCSSLSHRHNPVLHPLPAPPRPPKGWRISFMLALRVGFTQIFYFFSYWALAKAKAFSGPSPILKVSQLHSAKLSHRSFTQQRGQWARDNTCSNLLHFHSVKKYSPGWDSCIHKHSAAAAATSGRLSFLSYAARFVRHHQCQ